MYNVPTFILCPNPDSPDFSGINPSVPTVGSERERNYLSHQLGKYIEMLTNDKSNIFSINLFPKLTDPTLKIKKNLYIDSFHLNATGTEYFAEEFNKIVSNAKLNLPLNYWAVDQLAYVNNPIKKDITKRCKLMHISSKFQTEANLFATQPSQEFIFHTDKQNNPFIIIDCGYVSLLDKIILENIIDFENRLKNLYVAISKDLNNYETIFEMAEPFGLNGELIEIDLNKYFGKILYIKIGLNSDNYFHLKSLKIIENSYLNDPF
jgi:hypothetical protein